MKNNRNPSLPLWALLLGLLVAMIGCNRAHAQVPNLLTNGDYVYKLTGSNVVVYSDGTQVQSTTSKASDVIAAVLTVTNFIAEVGGGAALSGKPTYVAEAGIMYNLTPNAGVVVGPLIGYKYMKIINSSQASADVLKGGASFGIPFTNRFTGKIVWEPNATVAICTPTHGTSNNGGVGLDNAFGLAATFWHNNSIAADGFVEFVNSTGQGDYNRNYGLGGLAVKCGQAASPQLAENGNANAWSTVAMNQ